MRKYWRRKDSIILVIAIPLIYLFVTYVQPIILSPGLYKVGWIDRVAPNEILLEQFAAVALTREVEWMRVPDRFVTRWEAPIIYTVAGQRSDEFAVNLSNYAHILFRLTGIEFISRSDIFPIPTLHIRFIHRRELQETLRELEPSSTNIPNLFDFFCLVRIWGNRVGYSGGYMLVGTDTRVPGTENLVTSKQIQSCLLEEMTQLMGLPADSDLIVPSIFHNSSFPTKLSVNDMLIIRTLYDPRITAGMSREDALAQARIIIPELADAVKKHGVEALYQN